MAVGDVVRVGARAADRCADAGQFRDFFGHGRGGDCQAGSWDWCRGSTGLGGGCTEGLDGELSCQTVLLDDVSDCARAFCSLEARVEVGSSLIDLQETTYSTEAREDLKADPQNTSTSLDLAMTVNT